eukprot:2996373-Karenia_brevis.AAC.1
MFARLEAGRTKRCCTFWSSSHFVGIQWLIEAGAPVDRAVGALVAEAEGHAKGVPVVPRGARELHPHLQCRNGCLHDLMQERPVHDHIHQAVVW